jgi:hypothetical protein
MLFNLTIQVEVESDLSADDALDELCIVSEYTIPSTTNVKVTSTEIIDSDIIND